jgi:hypothetical protein
MIWELKKLLQLQWKHKNLSKLDDKIGVNEAIKVNECVIR